MADIGFFAKSNRFIGIIVPSGSFLSFCLKVIMFPTGGKSMLLLGNEENAARVLRKWLLF